MLKSKKNIFLEKRIESNGIKIPLSYLGSLVLIIPLILNCSSGKELIFLKSKIDDILIHVSPLLTSGASFKQINVKSQFITLARSNVIAGSIK